MMQSFSMRRRRRSRSVGISRSLRLPHYKTNSLQVTSRRIGADCWPARSPGVCCRLSEFGIRKENPMPRPILAEAQIHPAVREKIANYCADVVKEVQAAVAANDIVVVGMRQNPHP